MSNLLCAFLSVLVAVWRQVGGLDERHGEAVAEVVPQLPSSHPLDTSATARGGLVVVDVPSEVEENEVLVGSKE